MGTNGQSRKDEDGWPGGYISRGKKRDVYVIERRIGGHKFHVSTRCSSLTAAMKQLERFEADPANYSPADRTAGFVLSAELILEYREHQTEKGLSADWIRDVANMLADWADDLAGKDLLKVDLHRDIKPMLKKRGGTKARTNALKGFFRWARTEKGLLKHHQDVTLDLAAPKGRSAKVTAPKNVTLQVVRRVAPFLQPHVRDVLVLQMGTGWHITEVRRFALRGRIHEPDVGPVKAVLITEHKGGRLTRTPLRELEHVEAAKRIKARGRIICDSNLRRHCKRAAEQAGLENFFLGHMRHSVSTWAIEGGARRAEVKEFFDHRSENTTDDHYINAQVPTVSVPVHTLG